MTWQWCWLRWSHIHCMRCKCKRPLFSLSHHHLSHSLTLFTSGLNREVSNSSMLAQDFFCLYITFERCRITTELQHYWLGKKLLFSSAMQQLIGKTCYEYFQTRNNETLAQCGTRFVNKNKYWRRAKSRTGVTINWLNTVLIFTHHKQNLSDK